MSSMLAPDNVLILILLSLHRDAQFCVFMFVRMYTFPDCFFDAPLLIQYDRCRRVSGSNFFKNENDNFSTNTHRLHIEDMKGTIFC